MNPAVRKWWLVRLHPVEQFAFTGQAVALVLALMPTFTEFSVGMVPVAMTIIAGLFLYLGHKIRQRAEERDK